MSFKTVTKSVLSLLHKHQKNQKDVYIFTLPRAGSTLLLEILNTDANSKAASEPHALNKHNRQVLNRYFPDSFLKERYTDCSPEELAQMFRYFEDLSNGKTWNSFYWSDFLTKDHTFKTERTIFKTQKITYPVDKFTEHFNNDYGIYLLRHPISHSLSRIRNNWDTYNRQYLQSNRITATISEHARKKANQITKKGSRLEKFVLSWVLENYVFFRMESLKQLPENLFKANYETIVSNPEQTLPELCKKIDMEYTDKMLTKVQLPSHGVIHSTPQTINQIKQGDNRRILSEWRNNITEENEKKAFDILDAFNISEYQFGSDLPASF